MYYFKVGGGDVAASDVDWAGECSYGGGVIAIMLILSDALTVIEAQKGKDDDKFPFSYNLARVPNNNFFPFTYERLRRRLQLRRRLAKEVLNEFKCMEME